MTGEPRAQVIMAAGGLGTRVQQWARYLPKEFLPVAGRPGIVHVLDEIAALSPARVVIVYHPYYEAFVTWTRQVLSPAAHGQYLHAAGRPGPGELVPDVQVDFVAQHGPYADLTSLINGTDHLNAATDPPGEPGPVFMAFCDNLYPGPNPLLALRDVPPGVAVLARPYQRHLAGHRGVITTTVTGGHHRMTGLIEKPSPEQARLLEATHGAANLLLLEGRARLTSSFVDFARTHPRAPGAEAKLALTLAAYARTHTVHVLPVAADVIDLGTSEPVAPVGRNHLQNGKRAAMRAVRGAEK